MAAVITAALLAGLALLPAQADQRGQLQGLLSTINSYARERLPVLQGPQLEQLFEGEVVRIYLPPSRDAPCKAAGLLLSSQPRDRLWLALRSLDFDQRDDYREQQLDVERDGEVWYGLLKLPLLFGRRHWMIRVGDNQALAAATRNLGWEHHWDLVQGGEAKARRAVRAGQVKGVRSEDLDGAIYMPVNRGSWLLVALPGGKTLLGYQVVAVVGGLIPDQLVARYSLMRMTTLLRDLEAQAASIHQRYVAGHPPIMGGDGRELPRFGAGR